MVVTLDPPALGSHGASTGPLLAIGGLDSSGGAGLVRDFLTASSLEAPAHLVATAWTVQVPGGVHSVEARVPTAIRADIVGAIAAVGPHAAKVGMLATAAIAEAVADALAGFDRPVVFDPVLRASSGRALYTGDLAALGVLLRAATLTTPNLSEAAQLSGRDERDVVDADGALAAGEALVAAGARAVLVKGGHLAGDAIDVLVTSEGSRRFSAPRLPGPSPRGTGCALATAIAVALGRGEKLERAIEIAKVWLHHAIAGARSRGGQRVL